MGYRRRANPLEPFLRCNALLRAWTDLGLPLVIDRASKEGQWIGAWRDASCQEIGFADFILRCRRCNAVNVVRLKPWEQPKRLRLMMSRLRAAVKSLHKLPRDCHHLDALLGEPDEDVLALAELELLSGDREWQGEG